MAKSLILISTLLLVSYLSASAAPKTSSIGKQVRASKASVSKYKKTIQDIESQLQVKNGDYLQAMKLRQELDFKIFELEKNLNNSLFSLEEDNNRVKDALKNIALSMIENSNHEDLVRSQLLVKALKKEKKEIHSKMEYCNKLKEKSLTLRNRLNETIRIEKELYGFLKDLEAQKSDNVKLFLSEKENHEKLKSKYKKYVRAKKKKKQKVTKSKKRKSNLPSLGRDFGSPLKKYITNEAGEKGIEYTAKSGQNVYATKSGKVEYVGSLANVGNVIMIDHGNDIRSIYLGDIKSKVKKGQSIIGGSSIANTRFSIKKGNLSKVYFEVRRKNIAQNTAQLITTNTKL